MACLKLMSISSWPMPGYTRVAISCCSTLRLRGRFAACAKISVLLKGPSDCALQRSTSPLTRHFWLHRSEEHTSELQSLMRISYAVFCLKKKKQNCKHKLVNKYT